MARESSPPDVKSYDLDEFLTKFYTVPAFQRNYSWTSKEVEQLAEDLIEFFDSNNKPYYLLGDVILVNISNKSSDYNFEIIDGQQRITTLVILFAVIYRMIKDYDPESEDLDDIKALVYWKKRVRVKMSGEGSECVQAYLFGKKTTELPSKTPSQKAVIGALDSLHSKLVARFDPSKLGSLLDFAQTLQTNVYLSKLVLEDADSAFEFYERVNDRGKPLSKTDLLKNRLLQKITSDEDFEDASEKWSSAEKRLLSFGREGSLTFLMRQLINADLNKKTKESQLFDSWKPFVKTNEDCITLIDRIESTSTVLANLLDGKTPNGAKELHATGTRYLKFTQIIGIKIAAASLEPDVYDHLSKRLEARALLSLFALERSQEFETKVVQWSHNIQNLSGNPSIDDVNKAINVSQVDIDQLLGRAKVVTQSLRYGKTPGQTAKIRLILAIANHELNMGKVHHYNVENLLITSKRVRGVLHKGYDIEHIGAASTAKEKLGDLVDSLGNLVLFESGKNRSKGNKDVEYKAEAYYDSILFATKLLSETPFSESDLEKSFAGYRVATVNDGIWTTEKVEKRFTFYWQLFENFIKRDLVATKKDED